MKVGDLVVAVDSACRGQMTGIITHTNQQGNHRSILTYDILWSNGNFEDYISPRWIRVVE